MAGQCGLDERSLADAVRERWYRERVFAEQQTAMDMGIRAVPAVVLQGHNPIVGAVPYDELLRAAARALGTTAATL